MNKQYQKLVSINGKWRAYDTIEDLVKIQSEEIERLNNIISELEKWIKNLIDDNNNRYELYKDDKLHYEYEISNIKYQDNMLIAFLDKLQELKENNK